MKIDFSTIERKSLPAFHGGEKAFDVHMFNDGLNKIMKGHLEPGASIGLHTHETSSEIMFLVSGHGSLIDDGERKAVKAGDCLYCPKGHSHSLINDSDSALDFLAVVPNQ